MNKNAYLLAFNMSHDGIVFLATFSLQDPLGAMKEVDKIVSLLHLLSKKGD